MSHFAAPYFLSEKNTNEATHYFHPTSSLMKVPDDALNTFWTNYCESIQTGQNPYISEYNEAEKNVQIGYDVHLRFNNLLPSLEFLQELKDKINEYVETIISNVHLMLKTFFHITGDFQYLTCYLLPESYDNMDSNVFTSEPQNFLRVNGTTIEFNCRLIFPYARMEKKFVKRFYESILSQLQISANTQSTITNSLDGLPSIFRPLPTNMVEMYGSSSDIDHHPFFVYRCYGHLDGSSKKLTYDVKTILNLDLHSHIVSGLILKDDNDPTFWLPLLFSKGYYNNCLNVRQNVHLAEPENFDVPIIPTKTIQEGTDDRVKTLMNFLSAERANDEGSWLDIGQALHSINRNQSYLKLWKWFTNQGMLKTDADCDDHWYNFGNIHRVTIQTLEYFASQDSPDNYSVYREQEMRTAIMAALYEQEHTPVAIAFKACFPHTFVCRDYEKGRWCYFSEHYWVNMSGHSKLVEYMIGPFKQKLEELRAEVTNKIAQSRDSQYKATHETTVELFTNLIKKINNKNFKDSLCGELKVHYHDEKFNVFKNTNQFLFAVQNGVLDFRSGRGILRPGKPEDYITRVSNVEFNGNFDWNHTKVKEVMKYMGQVFRSKALKEYVLELIASVMISGNQNKIFPIFTGNTNNSKSKFVELINNTFGQHSGTLPTALLVDKPTGADQASPSLVASLGAKVVFLQEPDATKDRIRSGNVKYITGNDKIWFRDLFQKGEEAIEKDVTFVPILVTNAIPEIQDCQPAIWARTRIICFDSTWTEDAPVREEDQYREGKFPLDPYFSKKIPGMAPAFLWVLVQYYESYANRGMKLLEPPEVMIATENFRVQNNFYISFLRDSTRVIVDSEGKPDATALVSLDELYGAFSKWFKSQSLSIMLPKKPEFKSNLETILKQKADAEMRWFGFQLINQASTLQQILTF